MFSVTMICLRLLMSVALLAEFLALLTAVIINAARMPMMAMTTSSSSKVKAP